MDDLDHSMHIAEYDWTSFYEESEECSLLKPSIACLDNSSLSDSDDSENCSSPAFTTGQWEAQLCPDVSSDIAESNSVKCTEGKSSTKLPVLLKKNDTGGEQDDVTAEPKEECVTQVNPEIFPLYPAGHTPNTKQVHIETVEDTGTTDKVTNKSGVSNELKKEDRDLQTFLDNSINEPDLFLKETELNVNEPHATEGALCEDVSSVAPRAEKERWFVTLNDSPARQWVPASVKKKQHRRQKKTKNMCNARQEKSAKICLEIKDKHKLEGRKGMRVSTQLKQNLSQNSGEAPSADINLDLSQMSCEKQTLSENLIISNSLKEHITHPMMDRNKNKQGSSASMTPDMFTLPSHVESAESDDGVEFVSTHSYDSESYLSAAESVEEPLYHFKYSSHTNLTENPLFLTTSHLLNPKHMQDREIHSCDSTLSCNASATNCDGCDGTSAEPTLTFPSAGQRANKMPDDNSTCDNNTHSMELCTPLDTLRLQKQEMKPSASGISSGDQLSSLPVPDLTVTPCSVADSSETYAEAAGHTRPVYAFSAFWNEMEKMTINDILQLRKGRSTPPRKTEKRVTPNIHDSPTNHSFLVDTVEYNLSDGGLMDTSDTADSDYFTQPDESKPDRSSCEFSTSDFEEEYWQFIGERNPSPDPRDTNQLQTSESPFPAHVELSACSERKETPLPSEDIAGQCFGDQESHTSTKLSRSKGIRKSKTVYDVQALNTENLTSQSLFRDDESDPFLSCGQSLVQNMTLKVNDSLETLIPAPVLSGSDILDKRYQISIPEVFEYFFSEDKATTDSRSVTVYDPEGISVAPVFDCSLCTFWDVMSFSSLHNSQCSEAKPIPIFSCSHPIVRELTFPKPDYVFLNPDCKKDDMSPIRVESHSFTQASSCKAGAFCSWKNLSYLSIRKICFHDKGSIWCRRSGAWVFPVEAAMKRKDPPVTVVTEEQVNSIPVQLIAELSVQQTIPRTRQESIFSTLKQSDMCLVCIAFASWVLRSSDPEAADAWKAALLANVSALSAIHFLRQYVKKKNLQDDV